MLLIFALIGCTDVLASDYSCRSAEPPLGRWLRQQCGPSLCLLGPQGTVTVISYYAEGAVRAYPTEADNETIFRAAEASRPQAVLLRPTKRMKREEPHRYDELIARLQGLGFEEVSSSRLPAGCAWRLLLLHRSEPTPHGTEAGHGVEMSTHPTRGFPTGRMPVPPIAAMDC